VSRYAPYNTSRYTPYKKEAAEFPFNPASGFDYASPDPYSHHTFGSILDIEGSVLRSPEWDALLHKVPALFSKPGAVQAPAERFLRQYITYRTNMVVEASSEKALSIVFKEGLPAADQKLTNILSRHEAKHFVASATEVVDPKISIVSQQLALANQVMADAVRKSGLLNIDESRVWGRVLFRQLVLELVVMVRDQVYDFIHARESGFPDAQPKIEPRFFGPLYDGRLAKLLPYQVREQFVNAAHGALPPELNRVYRALSRAPRAAGLVQG